MPASTSQSKQLPPISRCSKCRRYCRLAATFLFSHIGLCALVVGYSIIGAFTFEALEAKYEMQKRKTMLEERELVVINLWNLTTTSRVLSELNWTYFATETLQDFEVTVVKAVRKEGYDGKDESPLQWTFSGALLYSIIVITTIGYGNVAPKTPWGKVVTIFYAIVGIPLLLLCLSNIGDAMAHSFKFLYWKVCCYLCVRPKKRRKRHRPLTTSRPPIIRPCTATNLHSGPPRPPVCVTPPGEAASSSSATYHTALEVTSSPTISSSTSSPSHHSPRMVISPSKMAATLNSREDPRNQYVPSVDFAMVPIISNKYALQNDTGPDKPLQRSEVQSLPPSPKIFTIMPMGNCDGYRYGVHQALPNNRFSWKKEHPGFRDPDLDTSDDDSSFGNITPDPGEDAEEVSVPMWLCLALVVSYICGGAVLFTFWEKWNFLDSSYFCFVTLTTIGFGDLVPGTAVISDDNQLTLGLCSLYLLFGMALLAMSFNLVQEEVTRNVKCIGRRIGIISDDEDD